jgi:transcriptional regulator GlxA family with amidase domain
MNICIVIYDGADEIDCIGPLEVFRRAALLSGDMEASLVTLGPQAEVTLAHGLKVRPDGVLFGRPDLVVVPGGGWMNRSSRGVRAEIQRGQLGTTIAELHASGTLMAGVCTGAMVLSAAGLLDRKPATTHSGALADLRATSATVTAGRVVDAGDVITCGGVTSSLDLALWVVERFQGAELAEKIAGFLEYQRSRDVWVANPTAAAGK